MLMWFQEILLVEKGDVTVKSKMGGRGGIAIDIF
jgi:hypothetical protein